jgi:hypothetical protein
VFYGPVTLKGENKLNFQKVRMNAPGPAPGSMVVVSNRLPFVLKRSSEGGKLERKSR